MKIDSHHHFWNYSEEQYGWIKEDMGVLRRTFAPADLEKLLAANGIDGVVTVQARQSVEETEWLIELAKENEFMYGVVGWLPLLEPNVRELIEKWSHEPKLRAVRHVIQDESDNAFILGKEFNEGITHLKDYGLMYDILIFAKHLPNTIKFVDQHPEQQFVLDHIAKPTIRAAQFDEEWKKNMLELAKRPNIYCKFSAVTTEVRDPEWDVELIRPYWDVALEAFGTERLMYGSDWPVCLLRTEYDRWVTAVETLSASLSATEQEKFWATNTLAAYGIRRTA